MVYSMTGFGRSEVEQDNTRVRVEIRSVNNRFCDINLRLPKGLTALETKIRDRIQRHVTRGTLNLSLQIEQLEPAALPVGIDEEVVQGYCGVLKQLAKKVGLPGDLDLTTILSLPGVLKQGEEVNGKGLWPLIEAALESALEDLDRSRAQEGTQLAKDTEERIRVVESLLERVQARAPQRVEEARDRLTERIARLLQDVPVDDQRIAMEVAVIAEKSDITEECVRLRSHCQQFRSVLAQPGPIGRKLTFLLQEMQREANTIGSKANDSEIAHSVVGLKEEVERIREQLLNIE